MNTLIKISKHKTTVSIPTYLLNLYSLKCFSLPYSENKNNVNDFVRDNYIASDKDIVNRTSLIIKRLVMVLVDVETFDKLLDFNISHNEG